jgi:uncharacterized protein GlcG (DUF336 family)
MTARAGELTLGMALDMAQVALQQGRALGFAPLAVAVLDAGGHLKALLREDGASHLRPQIAQAKARGVLGMGFGGRELQRRAALAPQFYAALGALTHGDLVPVPGGVLVRDGAGLIVGAVGISGDASENDEVCAVHAIQHVGLSADTGLEAASAAPAAAAGR